MATLKSILACFSILMAQQAFGGTPGADATGSPAAKPKAKPKFELKDGDRVVFLGNTLIERAQKYGYWETMLTARYPDRKIIFRNLGWDGDTVWAESRGIFDSPAKGYARMLKRVAGIKPTVIFVGYGNNEAYAGKAGLPRFVKQYNKLLDDLTKVSARGVRFVLLSPLRYEHATGRLPDFKKWNILVLAEYSDAIRSVAAEHDSVFVDLMSRFGRMPPQTGRSGTLRVQYANPLTENGRHLTQLGYEISAGVIREQLCPLPPNSHTVFDATSKVKKNIGPEPENLEPIKAGGIRFELKEDRVFVLRDWKEMRGIQVAGLKAGNYVLKANGVAILSASARNWSEGLAVHHYFQRKKLRQAIIAKNRLYFHSWRPQNVTYLFLFRKHEQGNNAKEVKEFLKLVAEKEKEIDRLKKPITRTYELVRVKNAAKK